MTYQAHYENALNPGKGDLKANLLAELRSHLGLSLDDETLYEKCRQAPDEIFGEWKRRKIDPADKRAVTDFYTSIDLYCYELIGLEIDAPDYRQDQLATLARLFREKKKLQGCDYGSGIGTLGIYLNRNGIACDFADVSETNLAFIRERLKRRGLSARTLNLLGGSVEEGRYDFITAFDVLEHVADPVALIGDIAGKLRPGGLFVFNLLYTDQPDTPHILKDPNPVRKNIRGFGLKKVGAIGEFKIYQKVERPAAVNALIRSLDSGFWRFKDAIRNLRG